jgi:5-methylcytosine-specific restriction endonuclease McrA
MRILRRPGRRKRLRRKAARAAKRAYGTHFFGGEEEPERRRAPSRKTVRAYRKYLKSAHWKRKKAEFKASERWTGKCERCESTKRLQIHHLTYERLGAERLEDLIALCRECHKKAHER